MIVKIIPLYSGKEVSNYKHVAFPIGPEAGRISENEEYPRDFAALIRSFWPNMSGAMPGRSLTQVIGEKTFYALVCHRPKNWGSNSADDVRKALDSIELPENEEIVFDMPKDYMGEIDPFKFIAGLALSNKRVVLYYH